MKPCRFLLLIALASPLLPGETVSRASDEPPGTSVISLPGAKPSPAPAPAAVPPKAEPNPAPGVPHAPEPVSESAIYFPRLIGSWRLSDAHRVLGQALRQRPALDENGAVNGQIYTFSDPSNRYKELELDFEKSSGLLRTVFLYPAKMTWQDCRRLWGMNVNATDAGKGRTFYSYTNRHLDILVDPGGKVISLGLY